MYITDSNIQHPLSGKCTGKCISSGRVSIDTRRENQHVCDKIQLYHGKGQDSVVYALRGDVVQNPLYNSDRPISTKTQQGIEYFEGERRYVRTDRAPEITLEWIEGIKSILSLSKTHGHEDISIPRAMTGVGWGNECQRRASQPAFE